MTKPYLLNYCVSIHLLCFHRPSLPCSSRPHGREQATELASGCSGLGAGTELARGDAPQLRRRRGGRWRGHAQPRQLSRGRRRRGTRGRTAPPPVARGCGLRRARPGAVDLASVVALQGEVGLEEGARGHPAGRRGEIRKEERLASTSLLFGFSGLLSSMGLVSHREASKSHGNTYFACVRVCCEWEGDLRAEGELRRRGATRAGRRSGHARRGRAPTGRRRTLTQTAEKPSETARR